MATPLTRHISQAFLILLFLLSFSTKSSANFIAVEIYDLWVIDIDTRVTTQIGTIGVVEENLTDPFLPDQVFKEVLLRDIAFDASDTLYAIDFEKLYKIPIKQTPPLPGNSEPMVVLEEIGSRNGESVHVLAYDHANNIMYAAGDDNNDYFYTVDLQTGQFTEVGHIDVNIRALEFYDSDNNGVDELYAVTDHATLMNPATGNYEFDVYLLKIDRDSIGKQEITYTIIGVINHDFFSLGSYYINDLAAGNDGNLYAIPDGTDYVINYGRPFAAILSLDTDTAVAATVIDYNNHPDMIDISSFDFYDSTYNPPTDSNGDSSSDSDQESTTGTSSGQIGIYFMLLMLMLNIHKLITYRNNGN